MTISRYKVDLQAVVVPTTKPSHDMVQRATFVLCSDSRERFFHFDPRGVSVETPCAPRMVLPLLWYSRRQTTIERDRDLLVLPFVRYIEDLLQRGDLFSNDVTVLDFRCSLDGDDLVIGLFNVFNRPLLSVPELSFSSP